MRHFVPAIAGLVAFACLAATAFARPDVVQSTTQSQIRAYSGEIVRWERQTWQWQDVMGLPRTQTAGRTLAALSPETLRATVRAWRLRALAARRRAQHPPHMRQFLCIHRYEGSWTDGGGPYYGGLQMDLGFQSHYGLRLLRVKGTADHWSPLEQIWVAERALADGRSFWAWPNTARLCGLV